MSVQPSSTSASSQTLFAAYVSWILGWDNCSGQFRRCFGPARGRIVIVISQSVRVVRLRPAIAIVPKTVLLLRLSRRGSTLVEGSGLWLVWWRCCSAPRTGCYPRNICRNFPKARTGNIEFINLLMVLRHTLTVGIPVLLALSFGNSAREVLRGCGSVDGTSRKVFGRPHPDLTCRHERFKDCAATARVKKAIYRSSRGMSAKYTRMNLAQEHRMPEPRKDMRM